MIYFTNAEFDSPDAPGSGKYMSEIFLTALNTARNISAVPYKINSGYRTKKHNENVNGSPTSSHLSGNAADIHCVDGSMRERIITGLILAGFNRIGIAKTFIHVDNDTSKDASIWFY